MALTQEEIVLNRRVPYVNSGTIVLAHPAPQRQLPGVWQARRGSWRHSGGGAGGRACSARAPGAPAPSLLWWVGNMTVWRLGVPPGAAFSNARPWRTCCLQAGGQQVFIRSSHQAAGCGTWEMTPPPPRRSS